MHEVCKVIGILMGSMVQLPLYMCGGLVFTDLISRASICTHDYGSNPQVHSASITAEHEELIRACMYIIGGVVRVL